jgi:hypothetical protein
MLLGRLFTVLGGDGWEHVLSKDGVNVYRKKVTDYEGSSATHCVGVCVCVCVSAGWKT